LTGRRSQMIIPQPRPNGMVSFLLVPGVPGFVK